MSDDLMRLFVRRDVRERIFGFHISQGNIPPSVLTLDEEIQKIQGE